MSLFFFFWDSFFVLQADLSSITYGPSRFPHSHASRCDYVYPFLPEFFSCTLIMVNEEAPISTRLCHKILSLLRPIRHCFRINARFLLCGASGVGCSVAVKSPGFLPSCLFRAGFSCVNLPVFGLYTRSCKGFGPPSHPRGLSRGFVSLWPYGPCSPLSPLQIQRNRLFPFISFGDAASLFPPLGFRPIRGPSSPFFWFFRAFLFAYP